MSVNDTNLFPGLDLGISVDVRGIVECPGRGVNGGRLGYQKRSGEDGTLGVIFHAELGVNVIVGSSNAGERRENDPM